MKERTETYAVSRMREDDWQVWMRIRNKNRQPSMYQSTQSKDADKAAKMAAKLHLKGLPYTF